MRLNKPAQYCTNAIIDEVETLIAQAIVEHKIWWGTRRLTRRIIFDSVIATDKAVQNNLSALSKKLRNV